jgi:hypothetical protein
LWALLERLKIGTGRQTNLKEDYILLGRRIGHNTIQSRERERERVRCLFPSPTNIKKMTNLCQNFIKEKELAYPRDILL